MAREKTCFASSVCCSDNFYDLSFEAQALYYQMSFDADNEGIVNSARRVLRATGATVESLSELVSAGFLLEVSDAHVVAHWNVSNSLRWRDHAKSQRQDIAELLTVRNSKVYQVAQDTPRGTTGEPLGVTRGTPDEEKRREEKRNEEKGSEQKRIEPNGKEEVQHESETELGEDRPFRARCPQCGAECVVCRERTAFRGWCHQCGDFWIEESEVRQ